MRVEDLMTTPVATLSPDDPVDYAFSLLATHRVRHVPVVHNGKVVGIISDHDLWKAAEREPWAAGTESQSLLRVPRQKVMTLMSHELVSIDGGAPAAVAAARMADLGIGALPVVEGEKLVGIITTTDILRAFARLHADE